MHWCLALHVACRMLHVLCGTLRVSRLGRSLTSLTVTLICPKGLDNSMKRVNWIWHNTFQYFNIVQKVVIFYGNKCMSASIIHINLFSLALWNITVLKILSFIKDIHGLWYVVRDWIAIPWSKCLLSITLKRYVVLPEKRGSQAIFYDISK